MSAVPVDSPGGECESSFYPGKTIEDVGPKVRPLTSPVPQIPIGVTKGNGGHPWRENNVVVTVEGTSSRAIILEGLQINVRKRFPPPDGVSLVLPCGDGLSARMIDVDFDRNPPKLTFRGGQDIDESGAQKEVPPVTFPYTVSESEPEYFFLTTGSRRCDCLWTATLHWKSNGEPGKTEISNHGKPFRSIGWKGSPIYVWGSDDWELDPAQD